MFIIMTTFLLAVKKIALHELKLFCDQNREKPAELMHFLEKKSDLFFIHALSKNQILISDDKNCSVFFVKDIVKFITAAPPEY